MSIQAKISSATQNVSTSSIVELPSDGLVALTQSSNVALNLSPADVVGYSKNGPDLIVQLKSGETIRIANFYAEGQEPSQLFLVDDDKLVAVSLPPTASDGALVANYVPQKSLAGFESLTSESDGLGVGAALLIGAGVVGGGAVLANSLDDDSSSSSSRPDRNPPGGTRDTTPPTAASDVKIAPDGSSISGKAEPGTSVGIDTNDDGKPDITVVAGPDGSFQSPLKPPLTNGETVTVIVTDSSGNNSPPAVVTAPDTTAPAPAGNVQVSPDGSSVSGTAEPGATVGIDINGDGKPDITVIAKPDGTFLGGLNPPLTNGETVTVVVTDPAGNSSPPTNATAPDTTAPAPAGNVQVSPDGSSVSGTAEPGASVKIDTNGDGNPDVTVVAKPDGTFQGGLTPPLTNGETVTVVVTDPAGNSSAPVTVTAPDYPDMPVINPSNGTVLTGTSEPNMTIELTDASGGLIGRVSADASGNWTFTPATQLPNGVEVNAVAKNVAGQVSPPASTIIDGVAPPAPTVSPSNGQEFHGTGEAGTTVTLKDSSGSEIGEAVVNAQGNWTVTPLTPPAHGEVITVVATDPAGNPSSPASVTVDAVAPTLSVDTPSNGVLFSGQAEANATVILKDAAGNTIAEVSANGSGEWIYTSPSKRPDGSVVTVVAKDASANSSDPLMVTVDASPPAAPTIKPTDGSFISGTAEANATVILTDGNGNLIDQVTADGSGNWTYTPASTLPNDAVINAVAKDAVGNIGAPGTITVDSVAPAAPLINATNGSILSGTAEPGSTVVLTTPAGELAQILVPSTGVWSYSPQPGLLDGTVVTAIAIDAASNESAPAVTTVDKVAPPTPGINASSGSLFTGTGEAGAFITLTGPGGVALGQVTVNALGKWSLAVSPTQADGAQVTATARDAAGNPSGPASTVVDSTAPNSPEINPSNGKTLSGTAEPLAVVKLTDSSGNSVGEVTAGADGKWSVTLSPELTNGDVVNATATDAAGNVSVSDSVVIDTIVPVAPVLEPSNGELIKGKAEPGAMVVISFGSPLTVVEVEADAQGNWSHTFNPALDHADVVSVVARDAALNESTPATLIVDDEAPDAPEVLPSDGSILTGTAEANSTVLIKDASGNLIEEVTVGSSGQWSYQPDSPLPNGSVINVTARDAAGNVSPPSSVTTDDVPPSLPTIEPSNGTNISGTGEVGSTITLRDGLGELIAKVTVQVGGVWSHTSVPALDDGVTITAMAMDASGNSSDSVSTIVDSKAPEAPQLNLSNGETVSGTAEPGSTVTLTFTYNGTSVVAAPITVPDTGIWTFTPAPRLDDKTIIEARATDAATNVSSTSSITVDAEAPEPPTVSPSNGISLSGTAEANSTVIIRKADGTLIAEVAVGSSGNWAYTPSTPFADSAVIEVLARDEVRNLSAPTSVTIDSVPPAPPVITPTDGITVRGASELNTTISLTIDGNTIPVTVGADGKWTYTPSVALENGTVIVATASDAAGNPSAPSAATVDNVAPPMPVIIPSNGEILSGTGEPGSTVIISVGGVEIGRELVSPAGTWNYNPEPDLDDKTLVSVVAEDAAGNKSQPAVIAIDDEAPAEPVLNLSNGSVITGTAEPFSVIRVTDAGGTQLAQTTADSAGNWSATLSPTQVGGAVVSATATDAANNTSLPGTTTIDTSKPSIPDVDPSNGFTVSGTADVDSVIYLTIDGTPVLLPVPVDPLSGHWVYTPIPPLADGAVVSVIADKSGTESAPAIVVVDAVAPNAPEVNPTNGEVITGTAEAGSTVVISVLGVPIDTVTVGSDGKWTSTPSQPPSNGTEIRVTAQDAAGNISSPASEIVDTQAPAAPVLKPSNGTVIAGQAEAGAKVILTDGLGNSIATVTADISGKWSFIPTLALANGAVVNAVAQDAAGNASPSSSTTVDSVAPSAPIIQPTNGSVVMGTAEANAKVTLTTASGVFIGSATADGSGKWSFSPSTALPHGSVVRAQAEDAAGNISGQVSAVVDSVAPSAPGVNPSNGSALTGTAEPGSTVIITGPSGVLGEVSAGPTGAWTLSPLTGVVGGDQISVVAKDAAGNTSPAKVITVDATAPDAPLINPSNGTLVSGTAEAGAKIVLTDSANNPLGEATANSSGVWTTTLAVPQANGATIKAVASDAAGNQSGPSSVVVDSVAPTAPVINPSNGIVISGTAEAGAKVILTDGSGALIGQALANGSGNWSLTPVTALPHNSTIRAVAQDAASNTSPQVSAAVDSVAPATPVINLSNGSAVTGTAEAGVSVVLTGAGGAPIAVVMANASGQWTYTPGTALANGTVVNAVARDAANNVSPQAAVTVDSLAPVAPIINPSNGHLITGTAEAGAKVILTNGNGDAVGEATANASGNWSLSLTPALANATVVNAVAKDATGNTSPSASITTDSLAPNAPVVSISTNGSVISGSAEPNSKVLLVINGDTANPITVAVNGAGVYSHTLGQALAYGSTVSATAQDAAGNVSPSTSVGYFDTSNLTLTVLEANDGWINSVEAGDGIQVKVDLRPSMLAGQQILVKLEAAGGYEVEVLHTLTAPEIAAGSVTVSLMPKDAGNPFPQGTANVTAEMIGGSVTTSADFAIDTVAPPALVGSALSLVGNVLTISTEPQTKLTVTMLIAGTEVTDTISADNNGLATLNLLQGFGVNFRPDQLLEAKLSIVGEDQAGNTTPVALVEVSDLLLGIATAGDFDANVSLTNLGLTGTAEPGQRVEVILETPLVNVALSTLADSNGAFDVNFIDALLGLGINISNLLALNNLGFKVNLKDDNGNTESTYGVEVGLTGQVVTVLGTSGNDVLRGSDGAERFESGDGDDLIMNVGSGDTVEAGAGHDAIQLTSTSYSDIDGGSGIDTVILGQGINLNNATASRLDNIEKIDLGADGANTLTLNNSTIRAITDNNNVLRITGESEDTLNINGATKAATPVSEGGVTYHVYNLGSLGITSQVWVEAGTVNVIT